jgi:hypothetical protein
VLVAEADVALETQESKADRPREHRFE